MIKTGPAQGTRKHDVIHTGSAKVTRDGTYCMNIGSPQVQRDRA